MAMGDHISVSRGIYMHHAIDLGNGKVIQYGGGAVQSDNKVEIVSMNEFSKGKKWKIENSPPDSQRSIVVNRAFSRIGESKYSVLGNNCEHFATWCIIGEGVSKQAETAKRCVLLLGKQLLYLFSKK